MSILCYICIFDIILCDGEQLFGVSMISVEKFEVVWQFGVFGVDVIEVGFFVVLLDDFEGVCCIVQEVGIDSGLIIIGLVCCWCEDIDKVWQGVCDVVKFCIYIFLVMLDLYMECKFGMICDQVLLQVGYMVVYVCSLCEDVEFSFEDVSCLDVDFLVKVFEVVI